MSELGDILRDNGRQHRGRANAIIGYSPSHVNHPFEPCQVSMNFAELADYELAYVSHAMC